MNIGSSNRQLYDTCNQQQRDHESVAVGVRQMYLGHYENVNKCKQDKFWYKQSPEVIDAESELSWRSRPLSKCVRFNYDPHCKKSGLCTSTFDQSNPVILAPEVCPIIHNNIAKAIDTRLPDLETFCTQ